MTGWTKKMGNKDNKCDREGTSCQTIQKTTCDRGWIKTTGVTTTKQDNMCYKGRTRLISIKSIREL